MAKAASSGQSDTSASSQAMLKVQKAGGFISTYSDLIQLSAIAGAAIFYILLFPYLLLNSITSIYGYIAASDYQWIAMAVWAAIGVFSAIVVYEMVLLRITPPRGMIELKKENSPLLFEKIEDFQSEFAMVKINRVILTENFELEIVKTPYCSIPVWSRSTLVIGMPFLMAMSEEHFDVALRRKFAQYSMSHLNVVNAMNRLNDAWQAYEQAYTERSNWRNAVFTVFFHAFTPAFRDRCRKIQWREVLHADSLALHSVNDEEVLEFIQREMVCRHAMDVMHWPAVRKQVRDNPAVVPQPYLALAKSFMTITPMAVNKILGVIGKNPTEVPDFRKRMSNVGHGKPAKPMEVKETAAIKFFGKNFVPMTNFIDKRWAATTLKEWREKDQILRNDLKTLKSILHKKEQKKISYREVMEYDKVYRKVSGKKSGMSLKDILFKKLPDLPAKYAS